MGIPPWSPAGYQPKTVSSTAINRPADKVYIIHRGTSAGPANSWNWMTWVADEWNWVDWLGAIGDEGQMQPWANPNPQWKALTNGDCDNLRTTGEPTWENCGQYPRYRFNGSSNMVFFDGHAKSYRRGTNSMQLSYPRNIFIPGISNNGGDIY